MGEMRSSWKFNWVNRLAAGSGFNCRFQVYLRTRSLAPTIVAHWPMDIAAAISTMRF